MRYYLSKNQSASPRPAHRAGPRSFRRGDAVEDVGDGNAVSRGEETWVRRALGPAVRVRRAGTDYEDSSAARHAAMALRVRRTYMAAVEDEAGAVAVSGEDEVARRRLERLRS